MSTAELQYRVTKLEQTLGLVTTQRILGRNTAGTGPVEQLDGPTVLALIGAGGGGGGGSVTSVALSLPSVFTVSGSPVTTAGTLTGTLVTQTANTVWAGPSGGGAVAPTFRALVAADIPVITTALVSDAVNTGSTTQTKEGNLGSWQFLHVDAWDHDTGTYGTGAAGIWYSATLRRVYILGMTGFGMTGSSLGQAQLDLPASGTVTIWTDNNDGAGTGLDSDLLDGQHGTYYLARANHTGTQSWSTLTGTPTTLAGYGITDAASDAELAAHTALTSGAHGISAFGATLVDDVNAAAGRTTLGLGGASVLNVGTTAGTVAAGDHNHSGVYEPAGTVATHAALTTGAHGMTAFGSSLVDDGDASEARTTLSLGTAAVLDAPSSGNASSGQVVKGSDTRLTDTRVPTSHTHPSTDIYDSTSTGRSILTAADANTVATVILGLGTASTRNVASSGDASSTQVVKGNDTRLTDARTPSSHTHAASDITSGTMATARLGSGTASATTFLRGDQAWSTPSASTTMPITKKTGAYTATDSDGVIICTFASDADVTLPNTGISDGHWITVNRTGGAGLVVVKDGSGSTLRTMNTVGASSTWVWCATDSAWYMISYVAQWP